MKCRAALDQESRDPSPAKHREGGSEIDAPTTIGHDEDLAACVAERVLAIEIGTIRREDQHRRIVARRAHEGGVLGGSESAVEHDARRLRASVRWSLRQPTAKVRVVGEHGADAHGDRVDSPAPDVGEQARLAVRDLRPRSAGARDPSVERHGPLGDGPRTSRRKRARSTLEQTLRILMELRNGAHHLDARRLERRHGAPGLIGVRIGDREDNARHTRVDETIGARWGLAGAAAGLEGDVRRGTTRSIARDTKRLDLGVGAAVGLVPSLTDDDAVVIDDTANRGIGLDETRSLARESECATQTLMIVVGERHVAIVSRATSYTCAMRGRQTERERRGGRRAGVMRRTMGITALAIVVASTSVHAKDAAHERLPTGKALRELVKRYLDAKPGERRRLRKDADARFAPLTRKQSQKLQKDMLAIARKHGPKLKKSGNNYFYEGKRGRYIISGKPGKALFISLHGGGKGSGDASAAASAMGGGGWWWIYPEVLEKTEHGWTDAGTEPFVMALIEAAKRTAKLDTNRIYITGHSMGGYGSWTLGAHHADVFGGAAPYAGAPTAYYRSPEDRTVVGIAEGVLPNFYNLPLHVFQSLDDKNVTPESNIFANKALEALKAKFSDGFNWRYVEVDGNGHAAPKEGYLPSLKWLASHPRVPRPRSFLWQPVLSWKHQFYWLYWDDPEANALVQLRANEDNRIKLTFHEGSGAIDGMHVLLGSPLVDLEKPVTITMGDETLFEGKVERRVSTLLMTVVRNDAHLLFDARVELGE